LALTRFSSFGVSEIVIFVQMPLLTGIIMLQGEKHARAVGDLGLMLGGRHPTAEMCEARTATAAL
jgi:hypothetical protein